MQSDSQVSQQGFLQISQVASTDANPSQASVSQPQIANDSGEIKQVSKRKKKVKDPLAKLHVDQLRSECEAIGGEKIKNFPGWSRTKKEFLIHVLNHLKELQQKKAKEAEKQKEKKVKSN